MLYSTRAGRRRVFSKSAIFLGVPALRSAQRASLRALPKSPSPSSRVQTRSLEISLLKASIAGEGASASGPDSRPAVDCSARPTMSAKGRGTAAARAPSRKKTRAKAASEAQGVPGIVAIGIAAAILVAFTLFRRIRVRARPASGIARVYNIAMMPGMLSPEALKPARFHLGLRHAGRCGRRRRGAEGGACGDVFDLGWRTYTQGARAVLSGSACAGAAARIARVLLDAPPPSQKKKRAEKAAKKGIAGMSSLSTADSSPCLVCGKTVKASRQQSHRSA